MKQANEYQHPETLHTSGYIVLSQIGKAIVKEFLCNEIGDEEKYLNMALALEDRPWSRSMMN